MTKTRVMAMVAVVAMVGCQSRPDVPMRPSVVGREGGISMASRYADATYVVSRGFEQLQVLDRNANGLATVFHSTKLIWAPALYKYTLGPYVVKENREGGMAWTLVIMDNAAVIAPQAGQDADVQVIPDRNLSQTLTGQRLNAINDWLAQTDFGVTATNGQTVRQVLEAILTAMGHSPDAAGEL